MSIASPTEVLKHEHQVILLVQGGISRLTERVLKVETASANDMEQFRKAVDVFENFVARCHHTKEEKVLFPLLAERGIRVEDGPIGQLLAEHREGRERVARFAVSLGAAARGDRAAFERMLENVRAYVAMLGLHIGKEDEILFPMAEQVMSAEDVRCILRGFDKIESEEMGEGVHETYHELAHEIASLES